MSDDLRGRGNAKTDLTASVLLVAAPFLLFLRYHRYPVLSVEWPLIAAVLGAVGVGLFGMIRRGGIRAVVAWSVAFAVFVDCQFNLEELTSFKWIVGVVPLAVLTRRTAPRVLAPVLAAFLLSGLVLPNRTTAVSRWRPPDETARADQSLPPLFHLVLDELASPDHLDRNAGALGAGAQLQAVLLRHGFQVYPHAVARYWHTHSSLASVLNDSVLLRSDELLTGRVPERGDAGGFWPPFRLLRNNYFSYLSDLGYALSVYQSDFLDVCRTEQPAVQYCLTYPANTARWIHDMNLPAWQRATALLAYFMEDRSHFYAKARDLYRRIIMPAMRNAGLSPPRGDWVSAKVGKTLADVVAVMRSESDGLRGRAVFLHVMDPHYPYARDEQCDNVPTSRWLEAGEPTALPNQNTIEGRRRRYGAYAAQVACLAREVEAFLTWLEGRADAGDAIVIVHGDHGSRIGLRPPTSAAVATMTADDAADYYLTLFAVRAPRVSPGIREDPAPLESLLRALRESRFAAVDVPRADTVTVFVDGPRTRFDPQIFDVVSGTLTAVRITMPTADGASRAGPGGDTRSAGVEAARTSPGGPQRLAERPRDEQR